MKRRRNFILLFFMLVPKLMLSLCIDLSPGVYGLERISLVLFVFLLLSISTIFRGQRTLL